MCMCVHVCVVYACVYVCALCMRVVFVCVWFECVSLCGLSVTMSFECVCVCVFGCVCLWFISVLFECG